MGGVGQDATVSPSNPEASPMARAAITGQQVRDLMTFHAVTVAPDDTVKEALEKPGRPTFFETPAWSFNILVLAFVE
jgi:hypothetical protein